MISLIRWWLMICGFVAGAFVLQLHGLFEFLWSVDHSKLSFVALGLFGLVTPFIGYLTNTIVRKGWSRHKKFLGYCWYASETMMGLGMLGTLLGFMMMFTGNMSHLDVTNPDSVRQIVVNMSNGLTTAVTATFVGLLTSMLTKLQLVNLETDVDEEDEG